MFLGSSQFKNKVSRRKKWSQFSDVNNYSSVGMCRGLHDDGDDDKPPFIEGYYVLSHAA